MLWEVERGRSCDSLRIAQAKLIRSQCLELTSTGKELILSKAKSAELDSLFNNAKSGQEILALQFSKDLNSEKRKTKRWRKVAFIQTLGIVGLVIILL